MWYVKTEAEALHVSPAVLQGALADGWKNIPAKARTPRSARVREAEQEEEDWLAEQARAAVRHAIAEKKRKEYQKEQRNQAKLDAGEPIEDDEEAEEEETVPDEETEVAAALELASPRMSRATCKIIDAADDTIHEAVLYGGGGGRGSLKSQLTRLMKVTNTSAEGSRTPRHGEQQQQPPAAPLEWANNYLESVAPVVGLAIALCDFVAESSGELSVRAGDMLTVMGVPRESTPE